MLPAGPLRPLLGWLAFGAVMCLLPAFVSTGTVRILVFANFLAIFAMSWDVISGRTGYISFGHPFLIGIAAYTTAMPTTTTATAMMSGATHMPGVSWV